MKDFFNTWRRKAGFATLVVACLSAALWGRSIGRSESILLEHHDWDWELASYGGTLSCYWRGFPFQSLPTDFGCSSAEIRQKQALTPLWPTWGKEEMPGYEMGFVNIHYSLISLPLTLLSAYLLLWKPHERQGGRGWTNVKPRLKVDRL